MSTKAGRKMEFQVVLMAAGHGNRMSPLSNTTPKPLLPVCNVPMVIYALKMLERHGFSTVILVAQKNAAKGLRFGIDKYSVSLDIDLLHAFHFVDSPHFVRKVTLPDGSDMGTVESLRVVKDKIYTDFFVVSADLITDFELHHLADLHRLHDSSVSCLLKATPEKSEAELLAQKASKEKAMERGMVDYIGIEPHSSLLILFENEENLQDEECLLMRKSVMHRHPRFQLHRDLLDAHLYIFAKWVIDFITADKSISTIKGELIPFLARKQFSDFEDPSPRSAALKQVLIDNNPVSSEDPMEIRCYAHVLPSLPANDGADDVLCVRANTTQLYAEVNRVIIPRFHKLLNITDPTTLPMVDPKVELADSKNRKKQIGDGSMVGVSCKFGSKISIKRSIIGDHCVIGDKVIISDSIVMGHVTIEGECTIKNSIISGNAHVGDKCSLDRVQVGTEYTVPDGTNARNTQLILDGLDDTGYDIEE